MHPDQATGSIVEFAMENHKPFAVIPCCVFPRLFPNRFVRDPPAGDEDATVPELPPPPPPPPPLGARPSYGSLMQRVVTHAHLVRFLMQLSGADTLFLPFEGANQVVYLSRPYSDTYSGKGDEVTCCGAIQYPEFGADILKWIGLSIL